MRTPKMPTWTYGHLAHGSFCLVELPAKKSASSFSPDGGLVGIVGKVFLHAHEGVLQGLLRQIFFPGLFRGNLENNLWSGTCLSYSPTSHMLEGDPFDHSDVRGQRILFRIGRLIEVEVFIHCTHLSTKEPGEHLHEIMYECGMN